ncbi:two-component system sensor histidine kinase CiaH [Clostridiales Family XIII bacterium PM5-7]
MVKSLRRKFIIAAMVSLLILMTIVIGGVALLGYYQMEETADSMLQSLAEERKPFEREKKPLPAFGYQISDSPKPSNYVEARINASGEIQFLEHKGMMELSEDEARTYVEQVLDEKNTEGKIGSYKYIVVKESSEMSRIVLLDMSLQMQTLLNTIFSSLLVGLICMVLMFFILFFVSGRVIRPVANNIEKQRQFVSNAGHEIKTPLGIIMANIDAMELHLGENKWSKNIRSQTERMHGLMDLLLLLARMDERADAVPMKNVNLSELVTMQQEAFLEPAQRCQVGINASVEEGLTAHGNPDYLEQLISILMDNAVKYANVGGDIFLQLTAEHKKNRLVVENSVEQLPDVSPDVLFDRFYRASAARTQKDGGYGIGLSAARAIAQMHGGKMEAVYAGDEGSLRIRFVVELP